MSVKEELRIQICNLTAELNLANVKVGLAIADRDGARAQRDELAALLRDEKAKKQ